MITRIDASKIIDAGSFHAVFSAALGFPAFYGRNMDAWVDCLASVDRPSEGMTVVHVAPGEVLTLAVEHAQDFKARCPLLFAALVECAAFVYWQRVESGEPAVLALAFHA